MFEDSTFESTGRIRTRSRVWGVAAFAFNASILAAMIVIPLLYPEALPNRFLSILISAPPPPPAPPRPMEPRQAQAFHGRPELTPIGLTVPTHIPTTIRMISGPEAPNTLITMDSGGPAIPSGSPFGNSGAPKPAVTNGLPKGPQRIASTLAEGLLIDRVVPVYPPIAKAAGVQGTVLLAATISTSGTIENLRVLNGPAMLQRAAMDAVSRWRYRPYLLNGQPIEVETTVSVVFSLGR